MSASRPIRLALPWHRRLEARVSVAVAALVAGALGALLLITIQMVSTQSRERAVEELESARAAFYSLLENRAAAGVAVAELVTELPVFRAHLTNRQLSADRPTLEAMADIYRQQLEAQFVVVTNAEGTWLASPGWGGQDAPPAPELLQAVASARTGTPQSVITSQAGELFLVATVPARFASEVLGTLSVGYKLTDDLARQLARLAQCEVILLAGDRIAATSLLDRSHPDVAPLVAEALAVPVGVLPTLRNVGEGLRWHVRCARRAQSGSGRLLLLADWHARLFVDRLRRSLPDRRAHRVRPGTAADSSSAAVSPLLRDIATASDIAGASPCSCPVRAAPGRDRHGVQRDV
jgi:hypothetical protein